MTVASVGMLPVVFDPDGADPLDINDGVGWVVGADLKMPPPAAKPQYASNSDTEGSVPVPDSAKYENRTIEFTVRVYGSTDTLIEDRLAQLYERMGRVHRKGGVLGVATPGGRTIKFDLVGEADADTTFSDMWVKLNKTDVSISLVARPFWRGEEMLVGSTSEATLPILELISDPVPGDVPALGRLVLTDTSGANQFTVIVGCQSENYRPDDNKALYFTGDALTPLGTSTTPGFGVIARGDLSGAYQAVLSSQLNVSKAHLGHHGSYRVFALITRPSGNTGAVSVRLEWSEGDFKRRTLNDAVNYGVNDREDVICMSDLGPVSIRQDAERWEFRVVAYSTVAGDDINIAALMLFPTDDCYIELSGTRTIEIPTSFAVLDSLTQGSGLLTGDPVDSGSVWGAGGADPTDFTADTILHAALRAEVNDANNVLGGRALLAPNTSTLTDQAMQAVLEGLQVPAGAAITADQIWVRGLTMRYSGTSNGLVAGIYQQAVGTSPFVHAIPFVNAYVAIRVGGTDTLLVNETLPVALEPASTKTGSGITDHLKHVVYCRVDASGLVQLSIWLAGSAASYTWYAWHASLASGGGLAAGSMGLYDRSSNGATVYHRRHYFPVGWVPTADAALFGNQTMTLAHDNAVRDDETGGSEARVSERGGRYLKLRPGQSRLLVTALRNDPALAANANADALEAELYATPRGLMVPPG